MQLFCSQCKVTTKLNYSLKWRKLNLSGVADDLGLSLNEAGVADGQTVEEVHENNDDEEDEGEEEGVRHGAQSERYSVSVIRNARTQSDRF